MEISERTPEYMFTVRQRILLRQRIQHNQSTNKRSAIVAFGDDPDDDKRRVYQWIQKKRRKNTDDFITLRNPGTQGKPTHLRFFGQQNICCRVFFFKMF